MDGWQDVVAIFTGPDGAIIAMDDVIERFRELNPATSESAEEAREAQKRWDDFEESLGEWATTVRDSLLDSYDKWKERIDDPSWITWEKTIERSKREVGALKDHIGFLLTPLKSLVIEVAKLPEKLPDWVFTPFDDRDGNTPFGPRDVPPGGGGTGVATGVQAPPLVDPLSDNPFGTVDVVPLPKRNRPARLPSGRGAQFFADGGIVTDPTLGVVGEAGPEAVIPLSQLSQYMGMGMGRQETVIKLEVDDDLADFMTARVNRVNGRTSQEDPSAITRIGEF